MKVLSWVMTGVMALSLSLVSMDADAAKRMGGGKSFGKQSSNVTQRDAAPQAPSNPGNAAGNSAQNAAKPAAPGAAGAAAAAPKKPWGAMLGGLAAGLGLAWLASTLGFGEAFAQFMMFALFALIIMIAVGWFMRRRAMQAQPGMQSAGMQRSPYAVAGAGAGMSGSPADVSAQRSYQPDHVGNDASARPWERNSTAFTAQPTPSGSSSATLGGSLIGSRLSGSTSNWSVPADFDAPGFLAHAKQAFVSLQAAWDKSDVNTLRTMMTDEMLQEIRQQLQDREQHTGGVSNHTEVAALDAKLLGIEDTGTEWMASVEFSGMIKEDPSQSPGPFREVWNMTKPKDGRSGWLVAGLQALG
jgi:predicted lipid-binding transport protein (Tim44 family)